MIINYYLIITLAVYIICSCNILLIVITVGSRFTITYEYKDKLCVVN